MSAVAVAASAALTPRNATEDAILAAAREALALGPYDQLTIEGIARRAFVSRTTVYFYFPNKRAVVDRLIQQCFAEAYHAGAPYFEGEGDARTQLYQALARVVGVVNANAQTLRLAVQLSGREDRLPPEWAPYISRLILAAERRIRRDQRRGTAARDISARVAAQALTAMVERQLTIDVVRGREDASETLHTLAELWWRGLYAFSPDGGASA